MNQMCLEFKENPFNKCDGNLSNDKLVVLAKYLLVTMLLLSVTYLSAQNSKLYLFF